MLRCAGCKKAITKGKYVNARGKNWHPECFCCVSCGKKLFGASFYEREGKPWCVSCYEKAFVLHCDVCGVALGSEYKQDVWGNRYCPRHEASPGVCDYCGRVMSKTLTGGGRRYRDGRKVCAVCQASAVSTLGLAESFTAIVRDFFGKRGLALEAALPLKLVLPGSMPRGEHGEDRLGTITKLVHTRNGRESGREVEAVFVMHGMPAEKFCEVLAHEYGHAWLFMHGYPKLPRQAEEGLAQLFAHTWLAERGTVFSSLLKKAAEENKDEIYGKGLRRALKALRRMGMTELLAYVKIHRDLP